jgi:hypothetical protein
MNMVITFVYLYPLNSSLVHHPLRLPRLLLILLHRPPRSPALPPTPTNDADRRRQRKKKRQALAWKLSSLASCYGYNALCRRWRRPHQDMMHVANVHFKYFRCFKDMLQMFHTDIAKVNRYVAMVVHVCCKRLSPTFHRLF